jgi:sugar O-acyltransferase (sialic acid O-acetyltransferase NeuD family)
MYGLIIIGAGGFGRELVHMAKESIGYKSNFYVRGFVDDTDDPLASFKDYPPILGKIRDYEICENDVFICSISDVKKRENIIQHYKDQNAEFFNLVHITARINMSAVIGIGCIVGPLVGIGANVRIGNYCILQSGALIGHDVHMKDNVRIDNYSVVSGWVQIDENVAIHSHSVIDSRVTIGPNASISACSFVLRNVKPNTLVYGNPAKQLII